jgi:hypothetical protein
METVWVRGRISKILVVTTVHRNLSELWKQSSLLGETLNSKLLALSVVSSARAVSRLPHYALQWQQDLPFLASHPSRTISGNNANEATGSAQLTFQTALTTRPAKAIKAR